MQIIILAAVIAVYILLCYYIGRKIKNICIRSEIKVYNIIYWFGYWLFAFSFIFSTFLKYSLTSNNLITYTFIILGTIFTVGLIYSLLMFLPIDLFIFINRKLHFDFKYKENLKKIYCGGLSVFIAAAIILGYGFFNAKNKVVTNYEVTINKNAGNLYELDIVMLSDIHMGIEVKEKEIDKMIAKINSLHPDIVVLAGDIFDESSYPSLEEYAAKSFKNIKSSYGVYAVTGNHEYFSHDVSRIEQLYKEGDITFLQDECVKIADSFYIAGRNDDTLSREDHTKLKTLNSIIEDTEKDLPMILLDHKPNRINESEENKIDLQLSGHTHKGQIAPGNIITSLMNEDDYGYLKKGDFNIIVSSGYGTWGMPVRIGSSSEIVNVKVNFTGDKS